MKQVFLSTTTEFKEIETLEPGSWITLSTLPKVNQWKSHLLSVSTLPTYGHHSMRKKCLV